MLSLKSNGLFELEFAVLLHRLAGLIFFLVKQMGSAKYGDGPDVRGNAWYGFLLASAGTPVMLLKLLMLLMLFFSCSCYRKSRKGLVASPSPLGVSRVHRCRHALT